MDDNTKINLSPRKFKRIGKCNQCGECCKTFVSEWFMSGYDPIKGPRTTGCIYLEEQPNGLYKCLIRSGDIDWETLPEKVKEYYLRECLSYPNPQDRGHQPPRHKPPKKCGYKIVEVE